ncbi:Translation initiation factor IF-2 [Penicillium capsulatum]|nr:Translation initiation factor IF-2 [Penicillium capsulatum]
MHRPTVLRLSRQLDFASTGSVSSTRAFRASARQLNDESSSRPPAFTPKFGNRWGGGQAQKSTGLSAAEQAMRDALKVKSQPPPQPEPPKRTESQNPFARAASGRSRKFEKSPFSSTPGSEHKRLPRDQRRERGSNNQGTGHRRNDWTCPECKTSVFHWRKSCVSCNAPRPPPPEVPRELRSVNWDCPECNTYNFARNSVCIKCRTLRPDMAQSNKQQQPPPQAESPGKSKLQKLGRSFFEESEEHPVTEQSKAEKKDNRSAEKATEKPAKDKKDWSWDMSALEHLQAAEDQSAASELPKKSQRRDGRSQRRTVSEQTDFDPEEHEARRKERKRAKKAKAEKKNAKSAPAPLYLPEFISVRNLADVVGARPAQFVQRMEDMGFEDVTYDHILDAETAGLVAAEYNFEAIFETGGEDLKAAPVPEDTSALPSRPPVVTIMGHVDHGKTTILDWLRNSSVAATEHGGITQHIGAFSVAMPSGKMITFLDTPGHSAFLEMRRRGADVTDIVVLVVAADDSVKPQTIEAIKHATQANVPIIVAISKIDKEGRNPDRVKQDLSVHGVHVEDYGGDVQAIPVSGKTGTGMIELEEAIGALSEMLDHRAEVDCKAEGWVIEASTKSYGRVTSALIRRGTLRPGDVVVAGTTWARVRTLRNEAGMAIDEATPGMPVEIDGWREQPAAGTEILQATSEQQAKDVVEYRQDRTETQKLGEDMAAINEARRGAHERRRMEASDAEDAPAAVPSGPKKVNFIIKADVDGSAEAVVNSIAAIGNSEVYANVIRSGVGPVTEFDIEHAASADGKVISFNMPIEPSMLRRAEEEGVNIMDNNIIYKLIDEVKAVLSEHLPPTVTHRVTGEAEVQQVFDITIKGREKVSIAGCRVRNGMVNRSRKVKVIRGADIVYDGSIVSLKNVKKDVTEMRKDTECGIGFEGWTAFAVGDHVQCYEEIREKRYL